MSGNTDVLVHYRPTSLIIAFASSVRTGMIVCFVNETETKFDTIIL